MASASQGGCVSIRNGSAIRTSWEGGILSLLPPAVSVYPLLHQKSEARGIAKVERNMREERGPLRKKLRILVVFICILLMKRHACAAQIDPSPSRLMRAPHESCPLLK